MMMRIKNIFLLIATIFSFFATQAMEDGHYPWVTNASIIKFGANDFANIRSYIQNNELILFKNMLVGKTGINQKTIDFLCTQNKNITVVRNEIVPEQRHQISTFLETLENKESYNEFAADELKKTKKDLLYWRTIGFAKIFSRLGISIGATYLCYRVHNHFDNTLIRLGTLVAGIIYFGSIGKDLSDLNYDIAEFSERNNTYDKKYNNAQGIVNFFENVKKISEKNKKSNDEKGAGQ